VSELTDELALRYKCEYCTAGPGFWCRTIRGAKATMLHSDRTDGVRLAWLDGWEEGQKDKQYEIDLRDRREQAREQASA